MLLSKDITSNTKLPSLIRNDDIFYGRNSFEKIFNHIGLPNINESIAEIKPTFSFMLKSSAYGMRLNLSRGSEKSWAKNIGWGILGSPLLLADFLLDCVYIRKFKKDNKDLDLNVVFSASGGEGAWDIATMSMRGISSCQSWDSSRAHQLIGSIVDPCCGIIYLTNGKKTKHGKEMMFRAVVRYVVDKGVGPCLFMERTYPVSKQSSQIRAVNLLFAYLLHKHSNLPVLYDYCLINDHSLNNTFIPHSKVVGDVYGSTSYRDSNLDYRSLTENELIKFPTLRVIKDKYLTN